MGENTGRFELSAEVVFQAVLGQPAHDAAKSFVWERTGNPRVLMDAREVLAGGVNAFEEFGRVDDSVGVGTQGDRTIKRSAKIFERFTEVPFGVGGVGVEVEEAFHAGYARADGGRSGNISINGRSKSGAG